MTLSERRREYLREWRERNRERTAEYQRRYREEHAEELRAYREAYREANRERLRARSREYYYRTQDGASRPDSLQEAKTMAKQRVQALIRCRVNAACRMNQAIWWMWEGPAGTEWTIISAPKPHEDAEPCCAACRAVFRATRRRVEFWGGASGQAVGAASQD